jgi:hypothetical protein
MDIDIKKLVQIAEFRPEDKKKILDNLNTLSPEGLLDLWDLCLENLSVRLEIEISKRFHEGVFAGVANKQDHNDYRDLERRVLLDFFAKAELEIRNEELSTVQNLLKNYQQNNNPAPIMPNSSPIPSSSPLSTVSK